ncbi:MAG: DUF21 domain-containing protein [Planctomycetota bacterium]|nr:MAG: DUF21 domain-containing protein [Planctomycetota bacterium]
MTALALLLLALAIGALSSGAETGFYALNNVQLRHLARRTPGAGLLLSAIAQPATFLCTLLVAKNMVDDVAVHAAIDLGERWLAMSPGQASLAATLVLAPTLLLLADIWPKHFFLADPVRRMTSFAFPLWLLRWLLRPVTLPFTLVLRRAGGVESAPLRHQLAAILAEGRRAPEAQAPVLAAAGRVLDAKGRGLRPFLRRDLPVLPADASRETAVAVLSEAPDGLALLVAPGRMPRLLQAARLAVLAAAPAEAAEELPVLDPELDLAAALARLRQLATPRALVGRPGAWEGICDLEYVLGLLLAAQAQDPATAAHAPHP